MARVYYDGAEVGNVQFWDVATAAVTASASQAHTGQYAYQFQGTTSATKNLPSALSELYYKVYLYPSAGDYDFVRLYNSTTIMGALLYRATTGLIEYYRGTTLVTSSTIAVPANTWTRIELRLKVADSGGVAQVRIAGTLGLDYTGDTKPGTATTIDNIRAEGGANDLFYLDDIALNDTTGAVDNSWIGDERYSLLVVDGAGSSAGWTPSAGANWQCVDEIPPDSDTSYVETATPGALDLYSLADFDATEREILRAQVITTARGTVGGEQIILTVESGGTQYQVGTRALTTSYARYVSDDMPTDPDTGAAWTDPAIDALQAGQEAV